METRYVERAHKMTIESLKVSLKEEGFGDTRIMLDSSIREMLDYSCELADHPKIVCVRPKQSRGKKTTECDLFSLVKEGWGEKCNIESIEVSTWSVASKVQQFQLTVACLCASAVVIDATIPDDPSTSTVYPVLTPLINSLRHVIVLSRTTLPLNITSAHRYPRFMEVEPAKGKEHKGKEHVWTFKGQPDEWSSEEFEKTLSSALDEILKETDGPAGIRMPQSWINDQDRCTEMMRYMLSIGIALTNDRFSGRKRIFISYRSRQYKEVKRLIDEQKKTNECKDVDFFLIGPPKETGDESMTPMWQWMFMGYTEDLIREADELWVYYSDDYLKSWWTLMELVMAKRINLDRSDATENPRFGRKPPIRLRVYDPVTNTFKELDECLNVTVTESHRRRLGRLMANTRKEGMGPEAMRDLRRVRCLVFILGLIGKLGSVGRWIQSRIVSVVRNRISEVLYRSIPPEMSDSERKGMTDSILKMYADYDEMKKYAEDEVFQPWFWDNVSDRDDGKLFEDKGTGEKLVAQDGAVKVIDVGRLLEWPRKMITEYSDAKLARECERAQKREWPKQGSHEEGAYKMTLHRDGKVYYKLVKMKYPMYVWHCRKGIFPPKRWAKCLEKFHKFSLSVMKCDENGKSCQAS